MSALPQHHELEELAKADGGELVRAPGLCCVCDFHFKDELVVRYPNRSMRGGWAYVEPRHLTRPAFSRATRPAIGRIGVCD